MARRMASYQEACGPEFDATRAFLVSAGSQLSERPVLDEDELVAAARAELRQRQERLLPETKEALTDKVVDGNGLSIAQRLGQLLRWGAGAGRGLCQPGGQPRERPERGCSGAGGRRYLPPLAPTPLQHRRAPSHDRDRVLWPDGGDGRPRRLRRQPLGLELHRELLQVRDDAGRPQDGAGLHPEQRQRRAEAGARAALAAALCSRVTGRWWVAGPALNVLPTPLQGRLTLLLGPPGAGKSVFMQVLSGRMTADKRLRVRTAPAPGLRAVLSGC